MQPDPPLLPPLSFTLPRRLCCLACRPYGMGPPPGMHPFGMMPPPGMHPGHMGPSPGMHPMHYARPPPMMGGPPPYGYR